MFDLSTLDAVDFLATLDAESVDLVVTDPPYESLAKHRKMGTTTRLRHSTASSNDWFNIFPNARFEELFREVYRVLKKGSHFYLFSDAETMFVVKPLAEAAGFNFWKPLVWDKCLGPDTPVWTDRGVIRAADVSSSDRVMTPAGALVSVLATRETRAPSVRIALSDGSAIVASRDHRFVAADGSEVEAADLRAGMPLGSGSTSIPPADAARLGEKVRFDPHKDVDPITVVSVEDGGETDLVDIAIDDERQLYLLGNGVITHNCTIGMGYHYRARYEFVLFFEKGKRRLNDLGVPDILAERRIYNGYPTEKPVPLVQVLVEQSTKVGDRVVDPFCGSGAVGVAALQAGCTFAGNDTCVEAIETARTRLRDVQLTGDES